MLPASVPFFGRQARNSTAPSEGPVPAALGTSHQNSKLESFPLFDWLRFVLASAVALTHAQVITWEPAGNFAVQVFFALSGWLIGGILLRSGPRDLPRFYFNRGTRIWIPYVLAVAAIYLLGAGRDGTNGNFFDFLFFDLTFTHNWFIEKIPEVTHTMPLEGTGSHFWSISVEEQFYLAAPLLIVFASVGRNLGFWIAIALAACLSGSWYGSISLGVLAAVAQQRFGDWHCGYRWLFALIVGSCAAAVLLNPEIYPWVAPPAAIAIVLATAAPGRRSAIGEFFGGVSYPLYLYHWMGVFAANALASRVELDALVIGAAAYVIAVIVGATAYMAVDRNVLRWRRGGYTHIRGVAFSTTAYLLLITGIIGGSFLIEIDRAPAHQQDALHGVNRPG